MTTLTQEESFSHVFSLALRGEPCSVVGLDETPRLLPMTEWVRGADAADHALLDLCAGAVLDIGCGPGRLTAALATAGRPALGIDVVPEAIRQTRMRGGAALRRDVHDRLPSEGRWGTALLADGNLGIGGDPARLLTRARDLVVPGGSVVVEVEAPGTPSKDVWAVLSCAGTTSKPFRWSVVGLDDVGALAAGVGLGVGAVHQHARRWYVVLTA